MIKVNNYREETNVQSTSKLENASQASGAMIKEDSKTQLRSETPLT